MAIVTRCRHCRKRLKLPDRVAGRKVMCPRCERVMEAPAHGSTAATQDASSNAANEPCQATAACRPDPFGALSTALGLMAVLIVCIPYVGYAGFLFSAVGLLIGIRGLLHRETDSPQQTASVSPSSSAWQSKGITHPLFGVAICLFTLLLALLPTMLHELVRNH